MQIEVEGLLEGLNLKDPAVGTIVERRRRREVRQDETDDVHAEQGRASDQHCHRDAERQRSDEQDERDPGSEATADEPTVEESSVRGSEDVPSERGGQCDVEGGRDERTGYRPRVDVGGVRDFSKATDDCRQNEPDDCPRRRGAIGGVRTGR